MSTEAMEGWFEIEQWLQDYAQFRPVHWERIKQVIEAIDETEIIKARAMAKKLGYGSGSLASVLENLAAQSATARRALDDLIRMRNICRNPNHALADGTPHPHEIGPSCMAEPRKIDEQGDSTPTD